MTGPSHEAIILDARTGKLEGKTSDPEMVDHVRQYPDDYIVWERFFLPRKLEKTMCKPKGDNRERAK